MAEISSNIWAWLSTVHPVWVVFIALIVAVVNNDQFPKYPHERD